MHDRGLRRVARRDAGIRVYTTRTWPTPEAEALSAARRAEALVALVVRVYAPMPEASFRATASRLRYAAPGLVTELRAAIAQATATLPGATVEGVRWLWPAGETLPSRAAEAREGDRVRLLAPFDPVVWDRRRFELLWGWAYRFEAYTPVRKRALGYYALPLLWDDEVVGWANVSSTVSSAVTSTVTSIARDGLDVAVSYVAGKPPRGWAYRTELDAEIARLREFLRPRDEARASTRVTRVPSPSASPAPPKVS
jgi:uncharacterized protein YcaQ